MAFSRPASAFRNQLGSSEFPFEDSRYVLYVTNACPWATGTLMVAKLKKLVSIQPNEKDKMKVCFLHPTWQYTNPEEDKKIAQEKGPPAGGMGLAGGVHATEPHAGWVFGKSGTRFLPLGVLNNVVKDCVASDPLLQVLKDAGTAEDICSRKSDFYEKAENGNAGYSKILDLYGVKSSSCTLDTGSGKQYPTLRHLYESCGGFMANGVRATTPMVWDKTQDRVVNNESTELNKNFCSWGGEIEGGIDIYPENLREDIDKMTDFVYNLNNGVYRCGFSSSQPAYEEGATAVENTMIELEKTLHYKEYLLGEGKGQLTTADIRLFNTLIRMNEVYICYFKCGFANLLTGKYPNLLSHTARLWNNYEEIRSCIDMDDIRNHYYTSHALRNVYAVVPRSTGFVEVIEKMK